MVFDGLMRQAERTLSTLTGPYPGRARRRSLILAVLRKEGESPMRGAGSAFPLRNCSLRWRRADRTSLARISASVRCSLVF